MNFLKKLIMGPDALEPAPAKPSPNQSSSPASSNLTVASTGILNQTYRFIALDVETANSDSSSICQLGLACVTEHGRIDTINAMVDPEMPFDQFNIGLHGISAQKVAGQITFEGVFQGFHAFLQRHPLIQHSSFDKRAIEGACERYGLPKPTLRWHDSVVIARRAWPELKGNGGHGLASLKGFLGIEFDHHNAEEDARAAAMVVLRAERDTGRSFDELAAPKSRTNRTYPKSVSVDGNQTGPLYGHVACFTGALSLSREQAATVAAGAGITVRKSVTKKTTILVVGDQDLSALKGQSKSSKQRCAEELLAAGQDIRILGESQFLDLIEQKSP